MAMSHTYTVAAQNGHPIIITGLLEINGTVQYVSTTQEISTNIFDLLMK